MTEKLPKLYFSGPVICTVGALLVGLAWNILHDKPEKNEAQQGR